MLHPQLSVSAITSTRKMNDSGSDQSRGTISQAKSLTHFLLGVYCESRQVRKASQCNSLPESRSVRHRVCRRTSNATVCPVQSHSSRFSAHNDPQGHQWLGSKWLTLSSIITMHLTCLTVLCVATLSTHPVQGATIESAQWANTLHNKSSYEQKNRAWSEKEQEQDWNVKYTDSQWPQESSAMVSFSGASGGALADNICYNDKCIEITGLFTQALDAKVDPCEDFYKYTCGKYETSYPIPKFLKSWNHFERVFYAIRHRLIEVLNNKDLFDKATKDVDTNRTLVKLNQFYQGCINQKQRDNIGYRSLFSLIDQLGGWPMIDETWTQNNFDFERSYLQLSKLNLFFFVRIEPMVDLLDSGKTIFKITPPYKTKENIVNIFRPIREYYYSGIVPKAEDTKPKSQTVSDRMLAKYKEVIKVLKSSKDTSHLNVSAFDLEVSKHLSEISKIQSLLEEKAAPNQPMQSYQSNYRNYLHKISDITHLVKFNLTSVVENVFGIKVTEDQQFFVPDIGYLEELGKLLSETEKRIISNYLITNMVMNLAGHTTTTMINLLVATLDPSPLAALEQMQNICYEETSLYLPELLGKFYLSLDKVPEQWNNDVNMLVGLLNESFHQMLTNSEWMDQKTREEAISKLEIMSMNIGFPDWFDDIRFQQYVQLFNNINENDYFSSVVHVNEASHLITKKQINDRLYSDGSSEQLLSWPGHRQIIDVNAFYYFASNGVYIPVAIAQYPFYVPTLPKAAIFGSLGMIIGHEMTHAFDNTGRNYDNKGALRNWWSNETNRNFEKKTDCFVEQYSNYSVNSFNVDGHQTLAENIADNGGLREAYRAFKTYQSRNDNGAQQRMPASLSKYTPDQLFFLSFAHMWCTQSDPDDIESDIRKNVHSPPSIRVQGVLANFDQFARAFSCPVGSKMNPEKKCVLW